MAGVGNGVDGDVERVTGKVGSWRSGRKGVMWRKNCLLRWVTLLEPSTLTK